jgi:hypothetical protein
VHITGQLIGLFSFDIGYEIELAQVRALAHEDEAEEPARRRAAPPSLAYAAPPLRLRLGAREVQLGDASVVATASAIVHELGAVTILLEMPLACEVDALPALTATLTGAGPVEDAARALLEDLYRRITPAVAKPGLNPFVEDYYLIHIQRTDPPRSGPALLAEARSVLASTLRCEPGPLSESEIEEVFSTRLSYYPDDLVVTEWNVALVVDTESTETLAVLEYLNVQLVELRFYDAMLDRHVADTYALMAAPPRPIPLLYRPYRRAIDALAAIRLDVATIVERVHNALKLSGDIYLAKLYTRTAERLGLRAWEESVAGKLEVLQGMYDVLAQRVATARGEALELTIVVLILIELGVLLAGWG